MKNKVTPILNNMQGKKILVVGDLMLDEFIWGKVQRISPEAPVQVVSVTKTEVMPGGAGNATNNIAALGGNVFAVGVIGDDQIGEILIKEFEKRRANTQGVFKDKTKNTTKKTRIMGAGQHLLRIDYEKKEYITDEMESKLTDFLLKKIPEIDAVLISDYNKGTITEHIAKSAINIARQHNKKVLVDANPEHADFYKDFDLFTPNLKEATTISGTKSLEETGRILKEKFNANILITKGKDGMSLFLKNGERYDIATRAREVYDVAGAGDTVISTLALALAADSDLKDAINLANIAAGLVVEKRGVVTTSPEEIKKYLDVQIVPKVWGEEHWLVNEDYCGKRLMLKKGYRCSLHFHKNKDETFHLARGKVLLELNGEKIIMNPGESQRIKPGEKHRFTGLEDSELIEFSTNHKEDDSFRDELSGKADLGDLDQWLV